MVCEFINSKPIITINLVKRTTVLKYVFIGIIIDKSIYTKIENKTKLSHIELKELDSTYGKHIYSPWLDGNTKFIYDNIYLNDTVHILRYKICHYIGTTSYKIIPDNQHLWYQRNDDIFKQFGVIYKKQYLFRDQMKSDKIKVDNTFYKIINDKIVKKKLTVYNNNSYILKDTLFDIKPTYNIYVSNLLDELDYLTSKKIKINNKTLFGYIVKYWINYKVDQPSKDEIININKYIKTQYSIEKLLNRTPDIVSPPYLLNCIIIIRQSNIVVDMFSILTILREMLSYNMPFIKYKYNEWKTPKFFIYNKLPTKIDKSVLLDWVKSNESDIYNVNNIIIKIYSHTTNGINHYYDCIIKQDCSITIKLSYLETDKIQIDTLHDTIDFIANILTIIRDKLSYEIDIPFFNIKKHRESILGGSSSTTSNNHINTSNTASNTSNKIEACYIEMSPIINILYFNIYIFYHNKNQIILKDLNEFSSKFNKFIVKKKDTAKFNLFDVKYKKVSNFINITEICERVNILKLSKLEDSIIVSKLQHEFSIDYNTALNKISECTIKDYNNKLHNGINIKRTTNSILLYKLYIYYFYNYK